METRTKTRENTCPYLVVDNIIEFQGKIGLIERKNYPRGWALPGGFVDYGEKTETAAIREAKEETGLEVKIKYLLGVYSDPDRDPRGHMVSVAYVSEGFGEAKAGDDAKNFTWITLEDALKMNLTFDHKKILEDYNKSLVRR
ncbi:MAG TPA: NUDIX hydrolase [Candidatus Nanoarchaeia archaeon]|nr:NUDIX hydrolase [Candidatus Nanoarchaeia archaeon]